MLPFMMISCREATLLTEKKLLEGRISWWNARKLAFHVQVCAACRRYARQSQIIERVIEKRIRQQGVSEKNYGGVYQLSPETKDKITERLKRLHE